MRIVGGIHRSRKLESPKSEAIRPTSDKIRGALFNILGSRGLVEEAVVIDAFCGTGALGLEALSQGAKQAIFIDKSKNSINICKNNIKNLHLEDKSTLIFQDSTRMKLNPASMPKADLVFIDPPYRKNLVEKSVLSLQENNWLAENCFFVIETAKDEEITLNNIKMLQEKTYGDTKISIASF